MRRHEPDAVEVVLRDEQIRREFERIAAVEEERILVEREAGERIESVDGARAGCELSERPGDCLLRLRAVLLAHDGLLLRLLLNLLLLLLFLLLLLLLLLHKQKGDGRERREG